MILIPRPRKDEEEKKIRLTIALRGDTVQKLREIKNYNSLLQSLLDKYFKRQG